MATRILLLIALLFGLTESGLSMEQAQDEINPFAPFAWGDDLLTVVVKANNLPDSQEVTLVESIGDLYKYLENYEKFSLKGVKTAEQLQTQLSVWLNRGDRMKQVDLKNLEGADTVFRLFWDKSGQKKPYYSSPTPLSVWITPVVITGVPFDLQIELQNSIGLAIDQPLKIVKDSRWQIVFPYVIKKVSLTSRSAALNDKHAEIMKILEEKYKRKTDNFGNLTYKDRKSQQLQARCTNTECRISYESDIYPKILEDMYKKHESGITVKTTGGKADQKSGL